mmetsp:Transcript_23902/g.75290  ORF Transcript_23902/g.75290 Transcript_23902/m.75290 type:complete len:476 (-) Transcript_23902:79-1506(-)
MGLLSSAAGLRRPLPFHVPLGHVLQHRRRELLRGTLTDARVQVEPLDDLHVIVNLERAVKVEEDRLAVLGHFALDHGLLRRRHDDEGQVQLIHRRLLPGRCGALALGVARRDVVEAQELHEVLLKLLALEPDAAQARVLLPPQPLQVLPGVGGQTPPLDLLLLLADDVHGHEHVERVVDAPPDVFLVVDLLGLRRRRRRHAGRADGGGVARRLRLALVLHDELLGDLVVRRRALLLHLLADAHGEVPQALGLSQVPDHAPPPPHALHAAHARPVRHEVPIRHAKRPSRHTQRVLCHTVRCRNRYVTVQRWHIGGSSHCGRRSVDTGGSRISPREHARSHTDGAGARCGVRVTRSHARRAGLQHSGVDGHRRGWVQRPRRHREGARAPALRRATKLRDLLVLDDTDLACDVSKHGLVLEELHEVVVHRSAAAGDAVGLALHFPLRLARRHRCLASRARGAPLDPPPGGGRLPQPEP